MFQYNYISIKNFVIKKPKMEKFALATNLYKRYKFDECIVLCDEILKTNPNDFVININFNKAE